MDVYVVTNVSDENTAEDGGTVLMWDVGTHRTTIQKTMMDIFTIIRTSKPTLLCICIHVLLFYYNCMSTKTFNSQKLFL
jgi:hypothetical protein